MTDQSLPSRERGLKYADSIYNIEKNIVAPLAGAWIEMMISSPVLISASSLPSR